MSIFNTRMMYIGHNAIAGILLFGNLHAGDDTLGLRHCVVFKPHAYIYLNINFTKSLKKQNLVYKV